MGRVHGRRGRLYVGIASDTAAAEPVTYVSGWSINFSTDNAEVTAIGDSNKVYVSLELGAKYRTVHDIRVGHEILPLYPDKAPQRLGGTGPG